MDVVNCIPITLTLNDNKIFEHVLRKEKNDDEGKENENKMHTKLHQTKLTKGCRFSDDLPSNVYLHQHMTL